MSNPRKILVVGAGLSGVSVSIQLLRKGVDVVLVDNGTNASSIIAAGIMNPLVFRRMTKGWRVDDFVPSSKEYYASIEAETNTSFFHTLPMRRMFSTEHERELWLKKQVREDFQDYMTPLESSDDTYNRCINQFGSGRIKNAFTVNPSVFLSAAKQLIEAKGSIINELFDYAELSGTTYRGAQYDDIIFCEGYLGMNNPWFSFLPINPTKGEVLTVHSEKLPEDESLNRKCFNLPLGDKKFKIGSTIDWNNTSLEITEEGKAEILKNLSYIIEEEVDVLSHQAGIRPGSKDRRPFIGTHPEHANYHVFNGLGSKGYLLCPQLSKELVDWIIEGKELDPEVRIERYYPKA
ncbi:MAG: FAD-dependent oxidoreductase [Crocinitomicaceae bacterium]|nr:FAD-dependent oxidoreductase [Crocinitomicaceae bacterium]